MGELGFGELELLIIRALKELKQGSVRDVHEKLGGRGSYTTVMTVMSRLAGKGELVREKQGKQYIYTLQVRASSAKHRFKRLREKIFGGSSAAMVSYLLEDREISAEELTEIEALIQKKREEMGHG